MFNFFTFDTEKDALEYKKKIDGENVLYSILIIGSVGY